MYSDDFEMIGGCLVIILVVGLVALTPFIKYSTTRQGEHSGYVTAMEQGGFIYHNWNVYFKTDNSSSQEDTYCVPENSPLISRLKEANKNREQVTISYDGVRGLGLSLCTGEQITEIN